MEGNSQTSESNTRTSRNTMEISIAEVLSMFPGFQFSPADEELISFYLRKKLEGFDSCAEVIPDVDICKYEPWDLPGKSIIQSDNELSPNVKLGSAVIGTKRTLVFHTSRSPKGQTTELIMDEYCLPEKSRECEGDEEDCFADILKVEIVKLDNPTICLTPQPSPNQCV